MLLVGQKKNFRLTFLNYFVIRLITRMYFTPLSSAVSFDSKKGKKYHVRIIFQSIVKYLV